MLVVSKFGGSSVCDASQFKNVKNIISSNPLRRVVVVSALGKRNKEDNKITDLLYLLSAHIKYRINADHIWKLIYDRYEEINQTLNLNVDLNREFEIIKAYLKDNFDEAYLISRGEYLTALLMSKYLGYGFVDSAELFYFDYDKKIDLNLSKTAVLNAVQKNDAIVVPGFYGRSPNGKIHLFSRGGSDVTGAYLSAFLNASKYENFTDVSGILMADPKIIDNPKRIKTINYEELRELSYMGASVLHEETILPLFDTNIPIEILNTNKPLDEGTIITKTTNDNSSLITGIAGKKNYLSITVSKERQADKLKVMSGVLNILDRYNVIIEHLPTSIDSFSAIVLADSVSERIYEIIKEVKGIEGVTDVSIDDDIALIAVVGRNMVTKSGISGKIFGTVGLANVNIKMITQGAKELTIIMGVANKDFEKAIRVIYDNVN